MGEFSNQVYDVKLATEEESLFLYRLKDHMEMDFWSALPAKGGNVQVMVSPTVAPAFKLALRNRGIEHAVKYANAQEVADRHKMKTYDEARDMDWEDYHDFETIYAWVAELEGTRSSATFQIEGIFFLLSKLQRPTTPSRPRASA